MRLYYLRRKPRAELAHAPPRIGGPGACSGEKKIEPEASDAGERSGRLRATRCWAALAHPHRTWKIYWAQSLRGCKKASAPIVSGSDILQRAKR